MAHIAIVKFMILAINFSFTISSRPVSTIGGCTDDLQSVTSESSIEEDICPLHSSHDYVGRELKLVDLNETVIANNFKSNAALPSFCKREHLKMFPFAKIDIFVLGPCSRSGKIFKSLTRLVCELSIISINNFAKGNIFMSTITSQQLFFTNEKLKIV